MELLLMLPSTLFGVLVVLMTVFGNSDGDTTDFSRERENSGFDTFAAEGSDVSAIPDTQQFTDPIACYTCSGPVENSSCSDPVDLRSDTHSLVEKECNNGVCLKWTKYEKGVLQMIRTCSADLNFHLTLIDGVCRTERNGNGYLCMCGKHLCNSAQPLARPDWILAILLAAYSVIVQRWL